MPSNLSRQIEHARNFARLHVKGDPIILFNIWDAGSSKAVAETGAKALATGSWSVAAAMGFGDGEQTPLDLVLANLARISGSVDLPVSLDFEAGYARTPEALERNISAIIAAGAVGINMEDQVIGGDGLYSIAEQSARLAAIRAAGERSGVPLFINARTDLFLKNPAPNHPRYVEEAIERGLAYATAGASGLFVPGLVDAKLIERICAGSTLPVNVIAKPGVPSNRELSRLGVARISHGPFPYRRMIEWLKEAAQKATGPDFAP